MEQAIARFVANHARGEREAVAADVEPYAKMSLEERGRHISAACAVVASTLEARADRDDVLLRRDPPHRGYVELLARLRTPG